MVLRTKNVRYSIEYCHIYIDEVLTDEHKKSISIYKEIKRYIRGRNDLTSSILVDDYNPKEDILNIKLFLEELSIMEAKPDIIFFESELVDFAKKYLNEISNNRLRKNLERYMQNKDKTPCSLLVAVWYLLRLGQIHFGIQTPHKNMCQGSKYFSPAEKIITILPTKYIKQEKMALEIIKYTKYKEQLGNIYHIFFN